MTSSDPDVPRMPRDRVVLLFIDGPGAGHLMREYSGVGKNIILPVIRVGEVKYTVHVIEFDGQLYAVAALGELPPLDVLTRSIFDARLPPCSRAYSARMGGYIHKNTPPAALMAAQMPLEELTFCGINGRFAYGWCEHALGPSSDARRCNVASPCTCVFQRKKVK